MDFFINEFSIIFPTENKAFSEKFNDKINLIVGEKDSGKSSLARSILYTLGCDVRNFDFPSKWPNNIYIMDFNIDEDNYILIRKKLKDGKGKNYFKIVKNNIDEETYYDTKGFKDYLNEIMKIQVVTTDKNKQKTKLYPNHIFLPFYTDQDYSWQNYLTSTFTGINFINDYRKIILEYFTGVRSDRYYSLQLERNRLKNQLTNLSALIKSKEMIIEENNKNIHIIENIDIDSFRRQYKYVLDMYSNVIETEHKLKKTLNEKIYKKNIFIEMKSKLDSSIDEIISQELNEECPNCNQKINKSMENNYMIFLTQENLINEREKVNMYLHELEEEINGSLNEISNLKYSSDELKNKLDSDKEIIQLSDRADSYALSRVNDKLLKEISELKIQRDEKQQKLNTVEKNLRDLNKKDVSTTYKQLMISAFDKLNIPFSYKNYYDSNLESVNISLSGATKVQAYIAQYLTIYEIATNDESTINIPMFIDTFIKDDFNEEERSKTSKYIFDNIKDKHQSFIFISNNEQTLGSISEYDFNRINLTIDSQLLTEDYEVVYDKYSNLLSGL